MGELSRHLLSEHPQEAARALAPMVDLLEQLVVEGMAAGEIRPDLDERRTAGQILQMVMFDGFADVISGSEERGDGARVDTLWHLICHGITPQ